MNKNTMLINFVSMLEKTKTAANIIDFTMESTRSVFSAMAGNASTGIGVIDNQDTTNKLLMLNPEEGIKAIKDKYQKGRRGTKKYIPLPTASSLDLYKKTGDMKFFTDGKDITIKMLDENSVDTFTKKVMDAYLDNNSILEIQKDISSLNRRGGELSIDSAKKLGTFIVEHNVTSHRALTLQPVQHKLFLSDIEYDITQETEGRARKAPVGKAFDKQGHLKVYRNAPEVKDRVYFNDALSMIQNESVDLLQNMFEKIVEHVDGLSISKEEMDRLNKFKGIGPVIELKNLMNLYFATSYNFNEIVNNSDDQILIDKEKSDKARVFELIGLKIRQLLLGATPVEIASIAKLLSCLDKNNTFNTKAKNQFAMSVVPEEMLSYVSHHYGEIDVMGYPVAINKGLEIGETYSFINGTSENGSLLDFGPEVGLANGSFTIAIYAASGNDVKVVYNMNEVPEGYSAKLYAVKPLEFEVPAADFNRRLFTVATKKGRNYDSLIEELAVGRILSVGLDGRFVVGDNNRYAVRYSNQNDFAEEVTGEDLLNVTGRIAFVKHIASDYGDTIIFELEECELLPMPEEEVEAPDVIFANNDVSDKEVVIFDKEENIFEINEDDMYSGLDDII